MAIGVGLDVHRAQITYDTLNTATGEVATGRIAPGDRATLRIFLRRWAGEDVEAAVEATTGWRYVVEELQRAGAAAQLAEPADTAARGPTDKRDAPHVRVLLLERRLPQAWIAPEHIRARTHPRPARPGAAAQDARRPAHRVAAPIHAVLFHHGVRLAVGRLDGRDAHAQLAALDSSPAAQRQMIVALDIIAHINSQLAPLDRDLKAFAHVQPGCRGVWDGGCHMHAGIRPHDIAVRAEHPEAEFLIHPGCGCSTQAMDPWRPATSTPKGCTCARPRGCPANVEEHPGRSFIVATKTGDALLAQAGRLRAQS